MSIPLSTTTMRVERPAASDPFETAVLTLVTPALPGHLSAPSGSETQAGGQQERVDAVWLCDPTDLGHYDVLTDLATDDRWQVKWVRQRRGFGLDHMAVGLVAVHGGSSG